VQSITSTDDPAYAPTAVHDASSYKATGHATAANLEQQELAGRLLLTRQQLMDRVEKSLRPLFRGQMIQMVIGVALILLGVQCWARNTQIPHRVVNGGILHVYGVIVIAQAALVCTRIRRIDYSKPVEEIRHKLDSVRSGYLQAGVIIGFIWWLMWIPVFVAIGFDAVVIHRNSLVPSLVIGVVGLVVSVWLYWRLLKSSTPSSESWKRKLAGESLAAAYLALEEIENANIC
jgi:serine/threonine-protein kinase